MAETVEDDNELSAEVQFELVQMALVGEAKYSYFVAWLFRQDAGAWWKVTDILNKFGAELEYSSEGMWASWLPLPVPRDGFRVVVFYDEDLLLCNSAICNADVYFRHAALTKVR